MKPASFAYLRPTSLTEVHQALAEESNNSCVIAGGQTLVPMLSMRLVRPQQLIDIMRLPALQQIVDVGIAVRVGAAVRQADLLAWPGLEQHLPLLHAALPWVGHAQTRNRGTICGSVAHADPSAEIPLCLLAMDARIELSSQRKRRSVPASEFFTGMMSTARKKSELIEAVLIPKKSALQGCSFREIGRRHGDFAIVACAAIVTDGKARLAVGGVADRPTARDFSELDGAALVDALDAFAWELDAHDDLHASASYRRELVRRIGLATIQEARQCLV